MERISLLELFLKLLQEILLFPNSKENFLSLQNNEDACAELFVQLDHLDSPKPQQKGNQKVINQKTLDKLLEKIRFFQREIAQAKVLDSQGLP